MPGWYKPLGGTGLHAVPLGSALSSQGVSAFLSVAALFIFLDLSSLHVILISTGNRRGQDPQGWISTGTRGGHRGRGTPVTGESPGWQQTAPGATRALQLPKVPNCSSPPGPGNGGFIREGQESHVRGWWHSLSGPSVHPMAGNPLGLGEIAALAWQALGAWPSSPTAAKL